MCMASCITQHGKREPRRTAPRQLGPVNRARALYANIYTHTCIYTCVRTYACVYVSICGYISRRLNVSLYFLAIRGTRLDFSAISDIYHRGRILKNVPYFSCAFSKTFSFESADSETEISKIVTYFQIAKFPFSSTAR